jgi:hypothetical protein
MLLKRKSFPMIRPASKSARTLRVIGQVLEERRLKDFDLRHDTNAYLIRDVKEGVSSERVELRYTHEEVEELERQGRARRGGSTKIPDFTSLSQVLRAIGDYLDGKDSRLLAISSRAPSFTIEYETGQRFRQEEEHLASAFYDRSVRMYKQRSPDGRF